ncbi:hypothetical protein Droror1_Dr00001168 [Drosera rotundifolia]
MQLCHRTKSPQLDILLRCLSVQRWYNSPATAAAFIKSIYAHIKKRISNRASKQASRASQKQRREKIKVEQVFHMKEGTGEASYANNSQLQKLVISKAKTVVETSLKEMFSTMLPECLMVADLGCSSGPNALLVLKEIVDITDETYRSLNRRPPEFKVFLNDLPGNDFNTIFRQLQGFRKRLEEEKGSDFEPCFVSGTPGSFYQRLFPRRLLHFVHSANSLHWISQVPKGLEGEDGIPLNKGRVCAGSSSPPEVLKAYRDQFTADFSSFLKARSEEIVPGGFMSLTIVERFENDNIFKGWELLSKSLQSMASENESRAKEKERISSLKVDEVLHMVGGTGKTSYTNNSRLQVLMKARSSLAENLRELYSTKLPKCVKIVELGSASGPNALTVLSDIITMTDMTYREMKYPMPELKVFLNDLPGSDFNTIFRSLPSFFKHLKEDKGSAYRACYISGTPGTFYGRLYPRNSIHFAHSSYSINWLSEVPKGLVGNKEAATMKRNICLTKEGPPEITKAYQEQFGDDFTLFLRSRAEEIVHGGRMVLIIRGSMETNDYMWDFQLLGLTLMDMPRG